MRHIVDAVHAGRGAGETVSGATRRRKPYRLIICPRAAASPQSVSRPHSVTNRISARCCRGSGLFAGLFGVLLFVRSWSATACTEGPRMLSAHVRAGADRYNARSPHKVALNSAESALAQRPRTPHARQPAIACPLCASCLKWIRGAGFASCKLVCAGVRFSSCSAHFLPAVLSPREGRPSFMNVGI